MHNSSIGLGQEFLFHLKNKQQQRTLLGLAKTAETRDMENEFLVNIAC